MATLTNEERRAVVAGMYHGKKWKERVAKMPDYQILAIYQKYIEKQGRS